MQNTCGSCHPLRVEHLEVSSMSLYENLKAFALIGMCRVEDNGPHGTRGGIYLSISKRLDVKLNRAKNQSMSGDESECSLSISSCHERPSREMHNGILLYLYIYLGQQAAKMLLWLLCYI